MSLVPVEFVGKARALRNRLVAVDPIAVRAMSRARPLVMAPASRGHLPPTAVRMAVAVWRDQVPPIGRLAFASDCGARRLRIVEVRACGAGFRLSAWDDEAHEPGVAIRAYVLDIDLERRRSAFTAEPLASVGLHALARRFERGRRTTDADVLDELVVIAGFEAGAGDSFAIPVPTGRWVGHPCDVSHKGNDVLIHAVRSF